MTSASRQHPQSPQSPTPVARIGRRIASAWRNFFAPGDFPTLIFSAILLLMPALSLNAAGWPLDLQTLIPSLLLSILFGFLLSRSQYNELLGLMISGIYGVCFVLLIAAINDPGDLGDGVYNVFSRFFAWVVDATSGGINQDDLVFTLLVSGLFWFLGYNLAWHLFRVDRVWRAILPPALILITNSVYYTGDANLNIYLIVFMFITLLLLVRSNLDSREWDWYVKGVRVPSKVRNQVFRVGAVMALVVLLGAWIVPMNDIEERLNNFQEFLQADPLTELSELWNRLFAAAETQGPTTADYYGSDSLQLGGAIRLGEEVVFLVSAPPTRRYYWRSRVFDAYDNGRWVSAADTRVTAPEAPFEVRHENYLPDARVSVQQTFIMGVSASRLVYAAPQPLRVDLATRSDLRYTDGDVRNMAISVIRPMRVLYEGDSYTVTSLMSNATPDQLRNAGTAYPEWVSSTYHNYIPSMTQRTIDLARAIVNEAGAVTPYDQAKAIETWLRSNIVYNESIPLPPTGQDSIDWFLFELREGYCNYYASSMVLMLRSLGVPARLAAGFAQGVWNAEEGAYVVREKDAHTWVEVYFPGYGWVEFEPTSAQAPVNDGEPPLDSSQPSPTPDQPTVTPTLTLTPTPTITPTEDFTDPNSAVAQDPPPIEATPTPTATPTPSPTPVIIPTQPPPLRPQPRNPLSFILPALGALLVGLLILAILFAIAAFVYWYWEWRGLRGVNPIVRAYARLERYLGLLGIRLSKDQTPEERRQTIVREIPAIEAPVNAITSLYTAERYGIPVAERAETKDENADRAWVRARRLIMDRWARRRFLFFLPDPERKARRTARRSKRK